MQAQLLRRPQVLALVGFETTTLYELIKRGEFPRPLKIGTTAMVAWPAEEVSRWIEMQIQRGRPAAAEQSELPKAAPDQVRPPAAKPLKKRRAKRK